MKGNTVDIALLVLRLLLGLLIAGHGAQKLFGLFGGHGLEGTGAFFEQIGFRPGRTMALVAGATELGAGLLLALGLFTPLAGAGVIGTLLVAATTHAGKGLWATQGGYELPLVYAVLGAVLALSGAGAYSLDAVLGLSWSPLVSVGAIALGIVSGVGVLASRRKVAPVAA